jgi:hypothetical protein
VKNSQAANTHVKNILGVGIALAAKAAGYDRADPACAGCCREKVAARKRCRA